MCKFCAELEAMASTLSRMWACKWADIPLPHPSPLRPTPRILNANCGAVEAPHRPAPPVLANPSSGNSCALRRLNTISSRRLDLKIDVYLGSPAGSSSVPLTCIRPRSSHAHPLNLGWRNLDSQNSRVPTHIFGNARRPLTTGKN